MPVVLFDIDGTLIRTGRAGSRAMNRAFEDVFGIAQAFDGIQMAGRTDRWIVEDAASRAGVDLRGAALDQFRERYFSRLAEALPEPAGAQKGVLPGVQHLLEAIATRPDIFPALLTGNCEAGARIKLEYFDLWRFFLCGAYGDEALDRNDLFDVAIQRARSCGAPDVSSASVVVVGDTALDVACARAAGARAIAVATGPADVKTLQQSGAEFVVSDLGDTEAILKLL
jgi:phosphoglycolate phosphatase-like HAD superfamily hydrolase